MKVSWIVGCFGKVEPVFCGRQTPRWQPHTVTFVLGGLGLNARFDLDLSAGLNLNSIENLQNSSACAERHHNFYPASLRPTPTGEHNKSSEVMKLNVFNVSRSSYNRFLIMRLRESRNLWCSLFQICFGMLSFDNSL